MEFEYRLLSDERCKEIDSLNINDPYGYGTTLSAKGFYWITNKDETILFCCAFFPRHDDLEGNRISYLFFNHNDYHFIYYDHVDVKDTQSNGVEYRNMKIDILESDFIEQSSDKEYWLSLLKEVIENYEKKHIRAKNFNKKFIFEVTYKGESIERVKVMGKESKSRFVLIAVIILMVVCKLIRTPLIADYFNERHKEEVISEAAEYLKTSYPDDEFTYISGSGSDEFPFRFVINNNDDQIIKVYGSPNDDKNNTSKYKFYDTYYVYTVHDEAEEYFYDLFGEYISEPFRVKIAHLDSYSDAKNYDPDLNFVENYIRSNIDFTVYLFLEKEDDEIDDAINKIVEDYYKKNLDLWVTRIVIDDISIVDDDTVQQIKDSYDRTFSRRKDFGTAQLFAEERKHESDSE